MSQPASPIGSVEFIVKFESMQKEFVDALKEAIKDADIEIEGGGFDNKKLDEILYNLRYRLRSPWSGDYKQFMSSALPEMEFAKSKEAISDFASALRSKKMIPKKAEESEEEYVKRSEESASALFGAWIDKIESAIKDESIFKKEKNKLINLQGAIQQAMAGSWEYMIRTFVEQVLTESELEEKFRRILTEYGFNVLGNKRLWSRTESLFQKPGSTTPIKSESDLMKALGETSLSGEEIKEILEWDPGEYHKMPEEYKTELKRVLNKYYINAMEAQIPNAILKVWQDYLKSEGWLGGEENLISATGGKIHDVINIIVDDQLKNFEKFLKDYDVGEEEIERILKKTSEQITEQGWGILPWEGKISGSLAKWFKKKLTGYDPTIGLTFSAVGPSGMLGGISSTKLIESMEKMSKEDIIELIKQKTEEKREIEILTLLREIAEDTDKINDLKDMIEKYPELNKIFKV